MTQNPEKRYNPVFILLRH